MFFHISTIYALLLKYYFSRNQPQSINVGPFFVVNYTKDQNPRNGFRFIHPWYPQNVSHDPILKQQYSVFVIQSINTALERFDHIMHCVFKDLFMI